MGRTRADMLSGTPAPMTRPAAGFGGASGIGGAGRPTRRRFLTGVGAMGAAGLGLSVVTACAPGGQASPAKTTDPVTLEAWSPWEGTPADFERRQAALKEVHPHLSITWTGIGFGPYLDKITATVAADTPPDLPYLDNQHQGFFGRGKLLVDQGPLGKKDRDFKVDAIEPRALDLYTYEGQVLGYPWSLTTGQVFFNRALFDAAGRPRPDDLYRQGRWTWDAMSEAAVALTRRAGDGTAQQLGLSHRSIWRLALNANGTDVYDDFRKPKKSRLDEPAAIQALEWLQDLAARHRAAWNAADARTFGVNNNEAMNQGKVAMHVSWGVPFAGNARYAQVWDKMGWVPFPKGRASGAKAVADLTTEAQGIMRASKKQEAAWQYARWYHKDWQRLQLADKNNPRVASRSDLQDVARASLPAPQDLWFDMAKMGVARPVYPDRAKVEGEILNPAINPVLEGEGAPRAAALAVAKQINDYFAANPQ
jgi:multiple sugar transport system substrate-binding protein